MGSTSVGGMIVVGLYVLATAPLLFLVVRVHALKSDYTRLFLAALLLQLIPVGLIFFPFGFIGVILLGVSLVEAYRRHARLKRMGIHNPEVAARWRFEYVCHLWAIGFALEQKGVAYLFLDVVNHHGFRFLWSALLPASVGLWLILGGLIAREWLAGRAVPADPA